MSEPQWQTIGEATPPDGAWCWVWRETWAQVQQPPRLVVHRIDPDDGNSQWWTDEGMLWSNELTHMLQTFPGHKVLVLDNGLRLGVLRAEEAASKD